MAHFAWVALVGAWLLASSAVAAEREELLKLTAPPAASRVSLAEGPGLQAVKFARAVVRLSPSPWARVEIFREKTANDVEYATWSEGKNTLDPGMLSAIFREEMTAAGVPLHGEATSVFADEGSSDLQVGVMVTDMKGRFCRGCGWGTPLMNWVGVVTLDARWEIYSQLRGRVVATVATRGGFTAPKGGLAGDPERLIYEALRDNLRHLAASAEFRRAVTAQPVAEATPTVAKLSFSPQVSSSMPINTAVKSVVSIFAGDRSGSGALISTDGYILTNHHVTGPNGQVRVRWADGSDTVGEIVRTDVRRDVALIKTTPKAAPLPIRRTPAQLGEAVFAVGTPLRKEFANTLTRGVISATRLVEGQALIQSDVAVDRGNSGGPLLDEQGRVLALTVSGYEEDGVGRNINFFIPIDDALKALALTPAA